MTQQQLRAKIETPMSINNPSDVKVESIPLPPKELWNDLDNSEGPKVEAPADDETSSTTAAPVPVRYFGNVARMDVPLERPYVMPDGTAFQTVTVRRLTLGEVQKLLERTRGRTLFMMEIYAEMTGLPIEAIEGLDDDDGVAVTDAAYDFLPRRFKTDAGSSES